MYMCICVYVYVYLSAQCPLLRKLRCAHLLPRQLVSTLPGFGIPTPGMYLPDQGTKRHGTGLQLLGLLGFERTASADGVLVGGWHPFPCGSLQLPSGLLCECAQESQGGSCLHADSTGGIGGNHLDAAGHRRAAAPGHGAPWGLGGLYGGGAQSQRLLLLLGERAHPCSWQLWLCAEHDKQKLVPYGGGVEPRHVPLGHFTLRAARCFQVQAQGKHKHHADAIAQHRRSHGG